MNMTDKKIEAEDICMAYGVSLRGNEFHVMTDQDMKTVLDYLQEECDLYA